MHLAKCNFSEISWNSMSLMLGAPVSKRYRAFIIYLLGIDISEFSNISFLKITKMKCYLPNGLMIQNSYILPS